MTWPRRTLLWTLALTVGLVFQFPAARSRPPSAPGTGCPPGIWTRTTGQDGPGARRDAVTCRGWSKPDFIGGTAPADVLVSPYRPYTGAPCAAVHYYRVTFVEDSVGTNGVFGFAGGAARGSVRLTAEQVDLIPVADAYVTDVQLGSYEAARGGGGPACALASTYHFFCPATRAVDQFCITWVHRGRTGAP